MQLGKKHIKDTGWYFKVVAETAWLDYEEKNKEWFRGPKNRGWEVEGSYKIEGIQFDFLPTGFTRFTLFVLWKDKIHVWPCFGVKSTGDDTEYDVKCTEDKDEMIGVDFKESFHVFGKDRTYYFVTQSGKVYCSPKPAGKGKRKAEALWTDEKSPIRAVISDTASERTFVFTEPAKKDAKDGQRVYFELAEKIETKPYERVAGDGLTEPLKTVMEYAQVLVKDKKIK
jgi:hypothetical protein